MSEFDRDIATGETERTDAATAGQQPAASPAPEQAASPASTAPQTDAVQPQTPAPEEA